MKKTKITPVGLIEISHESHQVSHFKGYRHHASFPFGAALDFLHHP